MDEGLDLSRAVQSSPNIILRLCTAVRIDAMTGGSDAMALHSDELRMLSRRLGHASGLAYANRAEGLLALAEGFDANLPEHVVREKKERMVR